MDGKDQQGMYPEVYPGPPGHAPPPNQPMGGYGPPPGQPMSGYAPQMSSQQSSTTVVIQQPTTQLQNPLRLVDVHGIRDWNSGIFGCFEDLSNCLFTWCCYPCAICSLASRTGECVCTPCCVPGTEMILRARIRTIGGIRGNICNDCLMIACCGPCAACQEARELTAMGF